MDGESMPKVDLTKDASKLSTSDLHWIKRIEKENLKRVLDLKRTRKRNFIVGGLLTFFCFSIYGYTLNSVKQEQYFDDFELPETTSTEED